MDIGRTQLTNVEPRHAPRRRQLRHDGRRVRLRRRRRCRATRAGRSCHVEGDSAFGFSGMELETICRYGLPITTIVLQQRRHRRPAWRDRSSPAGSCRHTCCRARHGTRRSPRLSVDRVLRRRACRSPPDARQGDLLGWPGHRQRADRRPRRTQAAGVLLEDVIGDRQQWTRVFQSAPAAGDLSGAGAQDRPDLVHEPVHLVAQLTADCAPSPVVVSMAVISAQTAR